MSAGVQQRHAAYQPSNRWCWERICSRHTHLNKRRLRCLGVAGKEQLRRRLTLEVSPEWFLVQIHLPKPNNTNLELILSAARHSPNPQTAQADNEGWPKWSALWIQAWHHGQMDLMVFWCFFWQSYDIQMWTSRKRTGISWIPETVNMQWARSLVCLEFMCIYIYI